MLNKIILWWQRLKTYFKRFSEEENCHLIMVFGLFYLEHNIGIQYYIINESLRGMGHPFS